MLATVIAALIAAAPLDAPHAAVLAVISHDENAGCSASELRKAAAQAPIRPLGRVGADAVILAEVYTPCICGAQNCPFYAIQLTAGRPRLLLSTFGISVKTAPAAPLPNVIVRAHDSAMVSVETTFAFRNFEYAAVTGARVRGDNEERKPNGVPVRFAAGASSAQLHGTVSLGWYDEYAFDASKGQRLIVDGVRSRARVTVGLFGPGGVAGDVRAGVPFTLPATGRYLLHVDNDAQTGVPYVLTLAIR